MPEPIDPPLTVAPSRCRPSCGHTRSRKAHRESLGNPKSGRPPSRKLLSRRAIPAWHRLGFHGGVGSARDGRTGRREPVRHRRAGGHTGRPLLPGDVHRGSAVPAPQFGAHVHSERDRQPQGRCPLPPHTASLGPAPGTRSLPDTTMASSRSAPGRWSAPTAPGDGSPSSPPQRDFAFLVVAPRHHNGHLQRIEQVTGANRLGMAPVSGEQVTVPAYRTGHDDDPITCTTRVHYDGTSRPSTAIRTSTGPVVPRGFTGRAKTGKSSASSAVRTRVAATRGPPTAPGSVGPRCGSSSMQPPDSPARRSQRPAATAARPRPRCRGRPMQARWRAELPSPPTTQNEELTRCAAGHVLGPHLDVIGPRGEEHQPIDAQLRVVCGRSSVDVSTRVTEIERVPSVSARSTCSAAARRPAIDRSVSSGVRANPYHPWPLETARRNAAGPGCQRQCRSEPVRVSLRGR